MSENCPATCPNIQRLAELREKADIGTVTLKVTGCELYDSGGYFSSDRVDEMRVYTKRGIQHVQESDIWEVNRIVSKRERRLAALEKQVNECQGPITITDVHGENVEICGVDANKLNTTPSPAVAIDPALQQA